MLSQALNDLTKLLEEEGIKFTLVEFGYNYAKAVYSAEIAVKINNAPFSIEGNGRSIKALFEALKKEYSIFKQS